MKIFLKLTCTMAVMATVFSIPVGMASAETVEARKPENRADIQCLAIFGYVVGTSEDNSEIQMGAVGAMMYYWGRLNGRAPRVDWLEELKQFIVSDIDEGFKVEGDRCGAEMSAIGAEMTDWGQTMQTLANKMQPAKQHRLP